MKYSTLTLLALFFFISSFSTSVSFHSVSFRLVKCLCCGQFSEINMHNVQFQLLISCTCHECSELSERMHNEQLQQQLQQQNQKRLQKNNQKLNFMRIMCSRLIIFFLVDLCKSNDENKIEMNNKKKHSPLKILGVQNHEKSHKQILIITRNFVERQAS